MAPWSTRSRVASAKTRSTSSGRDRSATMKAAWTPYFARSSSHRVFSRSSRRATRTTLPPWSLAMARAISNPSPEEAPVTSVHRDRGSIVRFMRRTLTAFPSGMLGGLRAALRTGGLRSGGIQGGEDPAHALVAGLVPLRVLAVGHRRVGEVRGAGARGRAAKGAHGERGAVERGVRVVRLQVVVAGARVDEVRVGVTQGGRERAGDAGDVGGLGL